MLRVDVTGTTTTGGSTDAIVVYDEIGADRVGYLTGGLLANRVEFVKQKHGWRTKVWQDERALFLAKLGKTGLNFVGIGV